MGSRRWLRGQSDVMVSLSTPRPLTTLGASRSTGAFEEVRRVYEDFATALRWTPGSAVDGHTSAAARMNLLVGALWLSPRSRMCRHTFRPLRGCSCWVSAARV